MGVLLLVVLLSTGCSEELVVVPDNQPPADTLVSEVVMEDYINRTYLQLMGRKAAPAELANDLALLQADNASTTSRETFIQGIQNSPEYLDQLYTLHWVPLLGTLDTAQIQQRIEGFEREAANETDSARVANLQYTIQQLEALEEVYGLFTTGQMTLTELHSRCVQNYYYDVINMGAQNFVISLFEHFLNRLPTDSEQTRGIDMVYGFSRTLLLQQGQSKAELVDIILSSTDYHEGLVRDLFLQHLFREPTSDEMAEYTALLSENNDYLAVQLKLLTTHDYFHR